MGNMVADAMRAKYPGVEAAYTNSGGLRQDILITPPTAGEQPGEITWGEMFAVLPFGNRTVIETLTGAQMKTAFLNGFSPGLRPELAGGTGRFPQISGLKVQFHCTGTTPVVDGIWKTPERPRGPLTPVGPADTVRFVTNDFMFTGGDGYTVFTQGTDVLQPGRRPARRRDRLHHRASPVAPAVDGRIVGPPRPSAAAHAMPATPATRPGSRRVQRSRRTHRRRDPRARSHAQGTPGPAGRLPDEGRPGRRASTSARRRACATASARYWQKAAPARRDPPDPRASSTGSTDVEYTDHRLRLRGAPPRGQPHQALQAALQRPAQGRQELPVHQGHPRRRLPARRAHAQAPQRRQPLLRAVRVGDQRRRVDEPRPPALPVPDLHDRDQGRRAGAPAAVPPVPHQALPGPVHPGHLEGRLPRRHRPGRAVPRGPPGDARRRRCSARWRPPRSGPTTRRRPSLRDKIRAIERTMESQKMAAFARTELDLVGLARQDNQAAVQLFAIRDGKMVGRDVFLLDAVREASDDEVARELPRAVLRARDLHPARGLLPTLVRRRRRPRGVPRRPPRRPGAPPRRRSAARSAS